MKIFDEANKRTRGFPKRKRHVLRKWKLHEQIRDSLQCLRDHAAVGLHLGAGKTRIDGLTNCDLFDNSADLKLDATDLAHFSDGTVDLIEAHHMIEHLSFADTERALGEWARVLKPNGHVVITCPDLQRLVFKWLLQNVLFPGRVSQTERNYNMAMF